MDGFDRHCEGHLDQDVWVLSTPFHVQSLHCPLVKPAQALRTNPSQQLVVVDLLAIAATAHSKYAIDTWLLKEGPDERVVVPVIECIRQYEETREAWKRYKVVPL